MGARKDRHKWHHPIPVSLLETYKQSASILDIIDWETESLLKTLRVQRPSIFSGQVAIPIEKILDILEVKVTKVRHSSALGTTEKLGSSIQIALNTKNQHYFKQRFTLAHEFGHVWLNRLAGPFTFDELTKTKDTNYEEEFLCDVFASSLLMPKHALLGYIKQDGITRATVTQIASDFRVSISAVLRRLACVRGSILLFWREIVNPLAAGSERTHRIEVVYPNLHQLSKYFVPLYCTARDSRFEPNIFLRSLAEQSDISDRVRIRNLGSLPESTYWVHNIFFRHPSRSMHSFETFMLPRYRHDMATIIDIAD